MFNLTEGPLEIRSGIQLLDADIDSENSNLLVFVTLRFFWTDNRIVWRHKNDTYIAVDKSVIEKIWLPDFYFYDLRSFDKHELFRDFQGGLQLKRTETNETGLFFILRLQVSISASTIAEVQFMTEAKISFRKKI